MPRQVDPNTPAARLRAALLARNCSAADLARTCGFSRQNMQRFLDGEITRSKHYPAIAKALEVGLTWLLAGDPAAAPSWWTATVRPEADRRTAKGSTDALPAAIRASDFPPHWRLTNVPHGMVLGQVASETQVIVDPERTPEEGDLILLSSKDGARLRRLGPTIAGRIVLVSVDGTCAVETRSAPLSKSATVVVGTLFPRRRH